MGWYYGRKWLWHHCTCNFLSGYNKNYTPEDLRQQYYPKLNYDILSKDLSNTFNIKNTDFYYDSVHLSKEKLQEHLETNRPILVCVWNQPHDNRWTTASHYMVLLATDDNDMYIFLIQMVEKMIAKFRLV